MRVQNRMESAAFPVTLNSALPASRQKRTGFLELKMNWRVTQLASELASDVLLPDRRISVEGTRLSEDITKGFRMPQTRACCGETAGARSGHHGVVRIAR